MAGFNPEWMRILKKHQSMVPKGAPWPRWQQAARDASAEYHGLRSNPSRRRYHRGNPQPDWIAWALIGGGALLVYSWWQSKAGQEARQLVTNPQSIMGGSTGL